MTIAIVLAAGKGSRMNTDIAKQYLKIQNKEILYYSIKCFQDSSFIDAIILVTGENEIEYCENNIVNKYGFDKVKIVCKGGKERYHSVFQGLLQAKGLFSERRGMQNTKDDIEEKNGTETIGYPADNHIVMIHDGARPFVTDKMIQDSILAAKEFGACTVGMPVKDTIKIVNENHFGIETPNRKYLYQIQTPQTFDFSLLMESYKKMLQCENYNITDDTMLVEQYSGVRSKVVPGSYENIKITTPEDLKIAEKFLEKN